MAPPAQRFRELMPTPTQLFVLDAVERLDQETGVPPTIREVAGQAIMEYSVAYAHLRKLRDRGLVTWEGGKTRTTRLTRLGEAWLNTVYASIRNDNG